MIAAQAADAGVQTQDFGVVGAAREGGAELRLGLIHAAQFQGLRGRDHLLRGSVVQAFEAAGGHGRVSRMAAAVTGIVDGIVAEQLRQDWL
jgi:hypothetical protein